jgi:iojap-like ribosome-associated protein
MGRYFVIATSTSAAHMRGLERHLEEFFANAEISLLNKPEVTDDQSWLLLDGGNVIIHIMTNEARAFYDLESLWFNAPRFSVTFNGKKES